jgi:tetratricopeptide (TPR) repeat protein
MSLRKYLSYCNNSDAVFVKFLSEEFEDLGRYERAKNPVAVTWLTWLISFQQMERESPVAENYLRFMSFLSEKGIPRSILPSTDNNLVEDAAVGTLVGYAFITMREEASFDIHRLVHLAMRNWLATTEEVGHWITAVVLCLVDEIPVPKYENEEIWTRLLPHARVALKYHKACTNEKTMARLLQLVAPCYQTLAKYNEARDMYRAAVSIREKLLGRESPDTLVSVNDLVWTLNSQGKYDEAERLCRETLTLREKILGQEHRDTLITMDHLVSTLLCQEKYKEAETMCQENLKLRKRILGQEHPDTLTSMDMLTKVLNNQRRYDQAEEIAQKPLKLREKTLGLDHANALSSLDNLEHTLCNQGKYKNAQEIHQKVFMLTGKILGLEHPDTLKSIDNLANTL